MKNANSAMRARIESLPSRQLTLAPSLQSLLDGPFAFEGEAVVLEALLPSVRPAFHDVTEFEAWANKIHVDDYVEADSDTVLAHGILFSELLATKLESLGRPFRVLLAVDLEAQTVTVRFFAHRPGEAWADDDLETYRHEAILRWDVGETVR